VHINGSLSFQTPLIQALNAGLDAGSSLSLSRTLFLNLGDTVEIHAYNANAASIILRGGTGVSMLSIKRLSD
jgi:hypothetical protein